jgi:hypothetical protein
MHVYLGVPAYGGVSLPTVRTIASATAIAPEADIHLHYEDCCRSLLCMSFNSLWASALNMLEDDVPLEWFVLLHSDIGSTATDWLPRLIATAEQNGLDALAGVAAIKDMGGDTSTALWRGDGEIHRMSQAELREWPTVTTDTWIRGSMPGAELLINTGMLALRMGQSWNERFCWTIEDGVERGPNGKWRPRVLSEDWRMSLWFGQEGVSYGITQDIPVVHVGQWMWESEVKSGD